MYKTNPSRAADGRKAAKRTQDRARMGAEVASPPTHIMLLRFQPLAVAEPDRSPARAPHFATDCPAGGAPQQPRLRGLIIAATIHCVSYRIQPSFARGERRPEFPDL